MRKIEILKRLIESNKTKYFDYKKDFETFRTEVLINPRSDRIIKSFVLIYNNTENTSRIYSLLQLTIQDDTISKIYLYKETYISGLFSEKESITNIDVKDTDENILMLTIDKSLHDSNLIWDNIPLEIFYEHIESIF